MKTHSGISRPVPSIASGTTSPSSATTVSFCIMGQVYSLKNSKQLSSKGGKPRIIKNWKARRFEEDFLWQVPIFARSLHWEGPVRVTIRVYYPSMRQDLDCAILCDLLQTSGVIKNDRQIVEQHFYRELDRNKPRAEVTVEKL